MFRSFCLTTAMLLVGPTAALAQHEADTQKNVVTITLDDGTTHTVALADGEVVRLTVREGELVVTPVPRVPQLAFAGPGFERFEDVEIELGEVFERLPDIVREHVEGVGLPRVRIEREVPAELRREIAEVERETRRLALELRRAERLEQAEDAARLRSELERTLNEAFDLHQEARRARIEAIEQRRQALAEQAADLQSEIEAREANRVEVIERRRKQLTQERDELDW